MWFFIFRCEERFTFKRQTDGQTYLDEVALTAFDGLWCLFGNRLYSVFLFFLWRFWTDWQLGVVRKTSAIFTLHSILPISPSHSTEPPHSSLTYPTLHRTWKKKKKKNRPKPPTKFGRYHPVPTKQSEISNWWHVQNQFFTVLRYKVSTFMGGRITASDLTV